VTGPPFNAVPFPPGGSPGGAIEAQVGTATATFANGNSATFSYTVSGVAQAKQITRQVFAPPGTVCSPPAVPTAPKADMTFRVTVPPNTPPADTLQILRFFGQDQQDVFVMTAVAGSPGVFQTSARLPEGTVLQYMYMRNFDGAKMETYPLRALRTAQHWREILVRSGATVSDSIAQWLDLPLLPASTGTLKGHATDTSGKPLMGVRVSAGPHQTITRWDGSYRVLSVPAGSAEVTFRADNGEFVPTRTTATVPASGVATADAAMTASRMANVTFTVTVPAETPAGSIPRLFGDTYRLGMFRLPETTSVDTKQFVDLSPIGARTWSATVSLGTGTCVNYAYTLGSTSLNTERDGNGTPVRRSMCVTGDMNVDDAVTAWKTPTQVQVTLRVSSPTAEKVYLVTDAGGDLNGRLPMWPSGVNQASFVIYAEPSTTVRYRYEREGGPELITPDQNPALLRSIVSGAGGAQANDTIAAWRHQMRETALTTVQTSITGPVVPRANGVFQTGVEFIDLWRPSWRALVRPSVARLKSKNVQWVQIAAIWGMMSPDPPFIELGWNGFPMEDLVDHIRQVKSQGLHVALKAFPGEVDSAAAAALEQAHDLVWYDQYFDEVKAVFMYHAVIAQQEGVELLILENRLWYENAGRTVSSPATRAYINGKWKDVVAAIRTVAPAVKLASEGVFEGPEFDWYGDLDYLGDKWWWPLTGTDNATAAEMYSAALDTLQSRYLPLVTRYQKPFIFTEVAYPSANTSAKGTDGYSVSSPEINPDLPAVAVPPSDYDEQARAYQAVLLAFAATPWIQGAYSFSYWYYDFDAKDYSIRSKTAEEISSQIYQQLNGM
jgi:hypothetical protein